MRRSDRLDHDLRDLKNEMNSKFELLDNELAGLHSKLDGELVGLHHKLDMLLDRQ